MNAFAFLMCFWVFVLAIGIAMMAAGSDLFRRRRARREADYLEQSRAMRAPSNPALESMKPLTRHLPCTAAAIADLERESSE